MRRHNSGALLVAKVPAPSAHAVDIMFLFAYYHLRMDNVEVLKLRGIALETEILLEAQPFHSMPKLVARSSQICMFAKRLLPQIFLRKM